MGFERVVLAKVEEVDKYASAWFSMGDLYITTDGWTSTEDVYKIMERLKEVVLCPMRASRVGEEMKIEFAHGSMI